MATALADDARGALTAATDPPRLRVTTGVLCLLVLTVQLLPSIPFYFKVAGSMAVGMTVAAGICIAVMAACWAIGARASRRGLFDAGAGGLVLIATVVLLIVIHGIVADQIQRLETGRFVASLAPLVLLLGAGLALSAALRTATSSQITTLSWVCFWVMCAIIFFRLAGIQPRAGAAGSKSTFPFDETSHFALALGPVYLYRCACSRRRLRRDFWVILGFTLAIVLKSATFLAVAFIAAIICRRLLLILAISLAIAAVGLTVQFKYFISRADISSNNSNISALVYLEGWEMLDYSLVESDGWGVGFQQLGTHGSEVTAAEDIEHLTGGSDLNVQDGSFVMSKLGSELGVAGLLLVLGYCVLALKSLLHLRSGRGPPLLTFARSVVVAYAVDMFVRGTGYFTESTLLFVGALLVLAPAGGVLKAVRGPELQPLVVVR